MPTNRAFLLPMARLFGLGVILVLAAIGTAQAQARVTVGFADGPTFTRDTPPLFLDESFSSASAGGGEGLVGLASGLMRGRVASAPGASTFQLLMTSHDVLHFTGQAATGTPITFELVADGFVTLPPDVGDAAIHLVLNGGGGAGQPSVTEGYTTNDATAGVHLLPNVPFPVHLVATSTLLATLDNPSLSFDTLFTLAGANGATLDFFNTAHLLVDLAPGVAFTSVSGFAPVAAVPEPDTYALLLGGAGLLGWIARRTRLRHPPAGERGCVWTRTRPGGRFPTPSSRSAERAERRLCSLKRKFTGNG